MNVILNYDLSGANGPVKTILLNNGYSKSFIYNGNIINLPETTLFHISKTPAQAIADIQEAARQHSVRVTRAIATEREGTAWQAIFGDPIH